MSALLAGVATLAFIVVGGVVGVRLLLLARRTRQLPELAVGLSLVLLSAVSYPASLAVVSGQVPLEPARALMLIAGVAAAVAWAAVFVFTWKSFRPGEMPAKAVALAAGSVILALGAVNVARVLRAEDVVELLRFGHETFAIQLLALGAYAWTAVEGFRYHALMRRRLALGLADPVVTNRFLLWGLIGLFAFVTVSVSMLHAGSGGSYGAAWLRLLIAAAGIGSSVCLYLAFLPPEAWRRRLARRAASATPA